MKTLRWWAQVALSIWLLCFCFTATALANERWLVLPFENVTAKPEYNWLGEGIALLLSDALSIPGVEVVTPEERRAAYTRRSFSETMILSRASAIRVAQEMDADLLLVGTYKVTGPKNKEQVNLLARLIDVPAGRLAHNSIEAGAPLTELLELQGILAWDLLSSRQVPLAVSRSQFVSRFRAIPPRAFELYVKAVLAQDLPIRAELLRAALKPLEPTKSDPTFSPVVYELGKVYYLQQDYAAAIPLLSQIRPGNLYFKEAQFYLGLCYYYQGELDKAESLYSGLTRAVPSPGVFNNLAVIETKRGQFSKASEHLAVALAADRGNSDLWFNAGYALWLSGDYERAVTKLREAISHRSNDGEARYLLAKCYAQLGRDQMAKAALEEAKKYLPTVAQWERAGQVPMLARMVKKLDWSALSHKGGRQSLGESEGTRQTQARSLDQIFRRCEHLPSDNAQARTAGTRDGFSGGAPVLDHQARGVG